VLATRRLVSIDMVRSRDLHIHVCVYIYIYIYIINPSRDTTVSLDILIVDKYLQFCVINTKNSVLKKYLRLVGKTDISSIFLRMS